MRSRGLGFPLALSVLALVPACSGMTQRQPGGELPSRSHYLAYAGAPIDHFTWIGRFNGGVALSDNEFVVFVGADNAFLLKVWTPCGPVGGLPFVDQIALDPAPDGTVQVGRDAVRADRWNCPICEIRPIDYKRMLQDRHARAAPAGPQ